jgi:hypothetical protein
MFMSMGWDYVFEQRPPKSLLFIPHIIYEYEEWWNDIDKGTEELWENPVSVPLCPAQILHELTW